MRQKYFCIVPEIDILAEFSDGVAAVSLIEIPEADSSGDGTAETASLEIMTGGNDSVSTVGGEAEFSIELIASILTHWNSLGISAGGRLQSISEMGFDSIM